MSSLHNPFLFLGFLLAACQPSMSALENWPSGELLGRYAFDEAEGDVVKDYSFGSNHGIAYGCQRAPGVAGNALLFRSASDWVAIPHHPSFNGNRFFSVQIWIKPESLTQAGKFQYLAGLGSAWFLRLDSEGKVTLGINLSGLKEIRSDSAVRIGEWNHVAASYDGKEVRLFVNGKQAGASAQTSTLLMPRERPIVLGTCPWAIGLDGFVGAIDEFRLYSRPLPPAEVEMLYAENAPGKHTDQVREGQQATDPAVVIDLSNGPEGLSSSQSIGNRKPIELVETDWGQDSDGGFLSLLGPTSSLTSPKPNWLRKPTTFTVSFWVNLKEAKGHLLGIGGSLFVRNGYTGTLNFGLSMDGTWRELFATNPLTLDQWHHIVCVYDGIYMRIFIDGKPDNLTMQAGSFTFEGQPLTLGASAWAAKEGSARAAFRDVRVYNDALTIDQIRRTDPRLEVLVQALSKRAAESFQTSKENFQRWHQWALSLSGNEPKPVQQAQALSIMQTPAISSQKVLPETPLSELVGVKSNTMAIVATAGEMETLSVVFRADRAIEAFSVEFSELKGDAKAIPSESLNPFWVKSWYQDGNAWHQVEKNWEKTIVPELLLKDDSLITINKETKDNFIKLTRGESVDYAWVSEPRVRESSEGRSGVQRPEDFPVYDSKTLLPISLGKNETRQLWVKVKVPKDAKAGVYRGELTVKAAGQTIESLDIVLYVLPFSLPKATTRYDFNKPFSHGIYYWGAPDLADATTVGGTSKSLAQMSAELRDMYEHGIDSPIMIWSTEIMYGAPHLFRKALQVWKDAGFAGQPIYFGDSGCLQGSDPEKVIANVKEVIRICREMGIPDVYFYGVDERKGDELQKQRAIWEKAREAGAKIIVSGFEGQFEAVGDILDVCVWAFEPKQSEAAKWHKAGHRIWSYYNPQAGVENPEVYRRNFGLDLWSRNFDGTATYDYNDNLLGFWNDFNHIYYRRHGFVLPTADTFVSTIAWDGYREALDDVKYLTALRDAVRHAKQAKSDSSAAWIAESEVLIQDVADHSKTIDLDVTRMKIIQLLLQSPSLNTNATTTKTPVRQ